MKTKQNWWLATGVANIGMSVGLRGEQICFVAEAYTDGTNKLTSRHQITL